MKKIKNTFVKLSLTICLVISSLMVDVSAAKVADTKLFKGAKNLLNDVSSWLLLIAPIIAGVMIIYFLIRRKMTTEEHEKAKWMKGVTGTLICLAVIEGASGLTALITTYFG